jgi:uncharacterized protein (TIGR02145 family)
MKYIKAFWKNHLYLSIFALVFVLAGISIVYAVTSLTVTDNFTDTSKIASTVNLTVDTATGQVFLSPASAWSCGSPLFDTRDGKTYATVLIGSQCWMQQNLNIGTMVLGSANQGSSCDTIQKYCYSDNEGSCDTNGGLYQWDQTMCGSVTEGAQGICPAGWHVPTHNEFTLLERTLCTSGTCATDFPYNITTTGWRGTNEGTTMKNMSGVWKGLLTGYRTTTGTFAEIGVDTLYWSSLQSSTNAWRRSLSSGFATVSRFTLTKTFGFSLRCLKD